MPGTSVMKLLKYQVLKTSFELSEKFELKNKQINIKHSFNRNINKINKNQYEVILAFHISQDHNEELIPFNVEVVIKGTFEFGEWEDNKEVAINNGTAILFPYLRNLVSSVTLNGNVAPYVIPVMNVMGLFKENN